MSRPRVAASRAPWGLGPMTALAMMIQENAHPASNYVVGVSGVN